MNIFEQLAAPFASIHWRAQTVSNKEGRPPSAMALCYMDARDVMDRLDEVVGPDCWQDAYTETAKGRVIASISIKIDGEWVTKSDGAGDTDVEGEKGGMSDAFKRAAVKWGIGRYLYNMPKVWAECELDSRGKWKKWTDAGLAKLNSAAPPATTAKEGDVPDSFLSFIAGLSNDTDRAKYWKDNWPGVPAEWRPACVNFKDKLKEKEAA